MTAPPLPTAPGAWEPLAWFAATAAAGALGVRGAIALSLRAGVMDHPNERSSHTVATPRMGGVPLVLAVLAASALVLPRAGATAASPLLPVLLFASAMAVLGFADDVAGLSPLARFLVMAGGASLLLGRLLLPVQPLPAPLGAVPPLLAAAVALPAVVWFLNLYNFMDGIDGIAGGEALSASLFLAFAFQRYGEPAWAAANLLVAAASLGFLAYNRPPARIFLGDAGSLFLGAFFGGQAVAAAVSTPVPLLVLALPFANFALDATVTLLRRLRRGERVYEAHRSHHYQRLARAYGSHGRVTALEVASVAASSAVAWSFRSAPPALQLVAALGTAAALCAAGALLLRRAGGDPHPGGRPRPDGQSPR